MAPTPFNEMMRLCKCFPHKLHKRAKETGSDRLKKKWNTYQQIVNSHIHSAYNRVNDQKYNIKPSSVPPKYNHRLTHSKIKLMSININGIRGKKLELSFFYDDIYFQNGLLFSLMLPIMFSTYLL